MASSNDLVTLKGGVTVFRPALLLALSLEARGFAMRLLTNGRLQVHPSDRLTPTDCRDIRQHREDLIRVAQYETPEVG